MQKRLICCIAVWMSLAFGCAEDNDLPEGLADARFAGGPEIVWDLEARPFPEIPFPNDVATVIDETSPTGRRVNVSLVGASEAEEDVRVKVNEMTGFGVISPMWVRFDRPLDLHNLLDRHAERVPDFRDDAVYLVNVDPESDSYGELVLLDIGRGNYPILHSRPDGFFDNDPREAGTNLLFESYEEVDEDGDGELDPMEDTDDDGVWDQPNVLEPSVSPYAPGNTLEFYERETNSLILRTVRPLDPDTTYAMVLTSALVGENGVPIDSPFEYVNHTRQTDALQPLRGILPDALPERFDHRLKNVRFAWTFSTQDPTAELVAVRAGLYGEGPLSWLADDYPPRLEMVHNGKDEGAEEPMTFDLGPVLDFLVPLLTNAFGIDQAAANALEDSYDNVDYIVSGSYVSPYFLADDDGHATSDPVKLASLQGNPADDDETFDIDLNTGEARVGEDEVTFMCTVPETIPGVREPPFNTIIYSHAISSTRLEVVLIFGGSMAKLGFAMCAIDAVGHGVAIPSQFQDLVSRFSEFLEVPNFAGIVDHHRARDLNNDGLPESGGKYFTSDILHSRDNMRQTAIDQMQLVRILRSWDGERRWPDTFDESSPYARARPHMVAGWDQDGDGKGEIAGDFNGDGTIDFGGDVTYAGFGTSLGGIQSAILGAIEPTIKNVASNAGGGILGEIAIRTTISNVRNGVHLRMFGPLIMGDPVIEDEQWTGEMNLRMVLASADEDVEVPLGRISGIENGDRIVLRNPNREEREAVPEDDRKSVVHVRDGRFRIGISADALGATARRAILRFDPRVSLTDDIMQCKVTERCGEAGVNMCPSNHTCAPDGSCMPVRDCIWEFEPSMVEGRELGKTDFFPEGLDTVQLQAELARRTVSVDSRHSSYDFGDPLKIEIYSPDGTLKQVIDTFPENVAFQNIFYPRGTPLAAVTQGWGLKRQTPRMRKFIAVSQMLLEAADPAVWATHYFESPLSFPYEDERFQSGNTNLLMVGTIGDQTVPISTSIAVARAAGVLDTHGHQAEYEMTENQYLIDNYVYEGVPWFDRFPEYPNTLFDADDIDDGAFRADGSEEDDPNPDAKFPVRATIQTNESGVSGLRLPYLATDGEHTFNAPSPSSAFDMPSFMTNQVGWYLLMSGQEIRDDRCLEELSMESCEFFDKETFEPPRLR